MLKPCLTLHPNIEMKDLFNISRSSISQQVPYDYKSIMHFRYNFGSEDENPTIRPLSKKIAWNQLGQASRPTKYDYLHVNLLYCQGIEIT